MGATEPVTEAVMAVSAANNVAFASLRCAEDTQKREGVDSRLTERFLSARAHCVASSSNCATSRSLRPASPALSSSASAAAPTPPTMGCSPRHRTISTSFASAAEKKEEEDEWDIGGDDGHK